VERATILSTCSEEEVERGGVIFQEDDTASVKYIVNRGQVVLKKLIGAQSSSLT
jgi:hypothetical protein